MNTRTELLVAKCAENFTIQKPSVCQTRLHLICPDAGVNLSVLKENESEKLMMILAVMNPTDFLYSTKYVHILSLPERANPKNHKVRSF